MAYLWQENEDADDDDDDTDDGGFFVNVPKVDPTQQNEEMDAGLILMMILEDQVQVPIDHRFFCQSQFFHKMINNNPSKHDEIQL